MSELTDQSEVVKEAFLKRLNVLIADTVYESTTIASVSGCLIGAGIELLMRSGATDDEIQRLCIGMSETLLPAVRTALVDSTRETKS
jgi:hypothetical protein